MNCWWIHLDPPHPLAIERIHAVVAKGHDVRDVRDNCLSESRAVGSSQGADDDAELSFTKVKSFHIPLSKKNIWIIETMFLFNHFRRAYKNVNWFGGPMVGRYVVCKSLQCERSGWKMPPSIGVELSKWSQLVNCSSHCMTWKCLFG